MKKELCIVATKQRQCVREISVANKKERKKNAQRIFINGLLGAAACANCAYH